MFIALSVRLAPAAMALALASSATGEVATDGAPAVGVITAEYRSMTESTEINGRIQSRQRVDLVARVTAFLNERLFEEGVGSQERPVALSARASAFRGRRGGQASGHRRSRSAARECQCRARTRSGAVSEIRRNPGRAGQCGRGTENGGRAIAGRACPAPPSRRSISTTPRSALQSTAASVALR